MGNIRPGSTAPTAICLTKAVCSVATLTFAFGFLSCTTAEKPKTEPAPIAMVQTEQAQPANVSPPKLIEVQDAVKRVFKDSVEIDSSRKPVFIDGDFNGDNSQDVAVIVVPAPNRLAELNEEFPTWILKDPLSRNEPQIPRLGVTANDTLLAVIHGFGANGWRDSQATQTFLLKNVVGSGMTTHHRKDLAKDLAKPDKPKKTPYLRGDVISQVVSGNVGYLYFAGATYSWYDPKTFQEENEAGLAHMRARKNQNKQAQ
jgi:hypothetical protein